ncbi:MAG TPA: hypothetical protein PKM43_11830 [Verrucomicrobiota bacterium]|nr:hypothetical protein [Verrucomicrobiota bacterium]
MVASNSPSGFWFVLLVLLGFCLFGAATRGASAPVILDTDIGDDIGDTWRASGAHPHAQARLSIRPYEKSEWQHGLAILGCRNVLIQDLTIEQTGGDGIYLGAAAGQTPNRQVTIQARAMRRGLR